MLLRCSRQPPKYTVSVFIAALSVVIVFVKDAIVGDSHAFCAVGEDFRVVPAIPLRQVFQAIAINNTPARFAFLLSFLFVSLSFLI